MRIRKTFQGEIPENKIVNMRSNSQTDAYACAYANLLAYPVGSVYISTDSTSPASLFGGTWTQIKDKFLYATTTSNTTGGSNTNDHTHNYGSYYACARPYGNALWMLEKSGVGWTTGRAVGVSSNYATSNWSDFGLQIYGDSGGASNTNNMPAYYTVYAWRRTA